LIIRRLQIGRGIWLRLGPKRFSRTVRRLAADNSSISE
jgi:hypothetical protein